MMHKASIPRLRRNHRPHRFIGHHYANIILLGNTICQRLQIFIIDVVHNTVGKRAQHLRLLHTVKLIQKHNLEQPQQHQQQPCKQQKI